MKKIIILIAVAFFAAVQCFNNNEYTGEIPHYDYEMESEDWELFVRAVIWRESRGDANAIGDDGKAVGVLQLHKIMVDDANRISKMKGYDKKYTYNDRFSEEKSIEIFNIVQNYYNKSLDHTKALEIWNSGHPDSYKEEIFKKYNELKLV